MRINFSNLSLPDRPPIRNYPWEELLEQTEFWMDRYGDKHRITEMETSYLRNVLRFVRSGALQVAMKYGDAFQRTYERKKKALYVRGFYRYSNWQELPLYKAIIAELDSRGVTVRYSGDIQNERNRRGHADRDKEPAHRAERLTQSDPPDPALPS